jgi:HAE1 family hydrophobic/amphiphilic exporter-1
MPTPDTGRTERWPYYRFVVQRPVAVTMMVLAVLVFGLISFKRLPLALMPDISYPSVTLQSEFEGAAPEEVEQYVTRPLEQALSVTGNMVGMSSISRAGQGQLTLEFAWDTDMDQAIQEIREKLDNVWLPEGVERPLILRYDPSLDPMIRIGLTSGVMPADELRQLAEDVVKRELEKVRGVAAVKVKGGLEEEIRVDLDEREIALRGLDLQAISRQLAAENVNLAGGNLKEGRTEYIVRVLSEYKTVAEIAATRIQAAPGTWVQLSDIGRVYRGVRDPDMLTRVNGLPSVEIEIQKEADANIVQVAGTVRLALFGPARAPQDSLVRADSSATAVAKTDQPGPRHRRRGGGGPGGGPPAEDSRPWWLSARLGEQGISTHLLADQSRFIEGSINELKSTAISGGLLAVVVLFLFLRSAYTTLIVALTIPFSLIAAFGPVQLAGLSLNIMSLGGLALGVGMLVDNAIVVLESIFRCREEGDGIVEAAVRGTGEVGGAVIASTLTTVAVFLPMVFVDGVAGQIFGDLARVVVYSLSASLLLALTFIPMLAALQKGTGAAATPEQPFLKTWLRSPMGGWSGLKSLKRDCLAFHRGGRRRLRALLWPLSPLVLGLRALLLLVVEGLLRITAGLGYLLLWVLVRAGRGLLGLANGLGNRLGGQGRGPFARVSDLYPRALAAVLRHRLAVIGGVLALFVACVGLVLPRVGTELMPTVHQGEFHLDLAWPVGTPIERSADLAGRVEDFLGQQPEVASLATVAGGDERSSMDRETGSHIVRITVRLNAGRNPAQDEQAVMDRLRPFLETQPELDSRITYPVLFSFKTPVEVQLLGYELEALQTGNRRVLAAMEEVPGLVDLNSSLRPGNPELRITYDRAALGRLGLSLKTVAERVRGKVLGDVDTEFRDLDRRVDVRVRLAEADLQGTEAVRSLIINPGQPVPVPLSAVAAVELNEGPSEIRREDQERSAVIRANLEGRDLGSTLLELEQRLSRLALPDGLRVQVVGQSQEMESSLNSLYAALLLAVFLVYVVMASQFESLLHPLVILFSVPFAFVGVILALWLLQVPLSVVVFLGAILLVGIVVNNAIILVDTINLLRSRGIELGEAVIRAGSLRLRPILMTTGTTVLGLVPMALGAGDAAEMRAPLALTVIVGLASSTLLTLFVVPAVYMTLERHRRPAAGEPAVPSTPQPSGNTP